MDLDQLKDYWQAEQEKQLTQQKLTQNQLETMMNNIEINLQQIQQKNNHWYKTGTNVYKVMAVVWLLLIALYVILPQRTNHFYSIMLTDFLFSVIVAIVGLWSLKRQKEIFNVIDGENLAGSLNRIIKDFRRFYVIMTLQILIMLPALFYLIIPASWTSGIAYATFGWIAEHLDVMLPLAIVKLLCCVAFTIVFLALNHLYYSRAYFGCIAQMQQSLDELSAAEHEG